MRKFLAEMLPKSLLIIALVSLPGEMACQMANPGPSVEIKSPSNYTPHLKFDVTSVRQSMSGDTSYSDNSSSSSYYHVVRGSVWGLIFFAYKIPAAIFIENMPSWTKIDRYDITGKSDPVVDLELAKLPPSAAEAEKRNMVKELLADRFNLKIHTESRPARKYVLTTTERTSKLMRPISGEVGKTIHTCGEIYSVHGREILSKGCPFVILFRTVQQNLDADIIDQTGMSGKNFEFHLMWNPRTGLSLAEEEDKYPELKQAIREQLGLNILETKGIATYWVIDQITQPTDN